MILCIDKVNVETYMYLLMFAILVADSNHRTSLQGPVNSTNLFFENLLKLIPFPISPKAPGSAFPF